jgi:hypothetical protein
MTPSLIDQARSLLEEYAAIDGDIKWHDFVERWFASESGAQLVRALLDALLTAAQEQEHLQVERDAQRERFAAMMIRCSIATGHGDTMDDLIAELEVEVIRLRAVISTYGQHEQEIDPTRVDGSRSANSPAGSTAPSNEVTRTVLSGNVGADMVPFFVAAPSRAPEYDQGDSVIVWYDDLYNLAERKDRLMNALHRVLESAVPNPREHPAMWAAWELAHKVIRETKPVLLESGATDDAVDPHVGDSNA